MSDVVGWDAHAEAVARLRASYDAIPAGAAGAAGQADLEPVPRRGPATDAPGLDVSGLAGVIAVDVAATARHRRRAGHVHLRGPRRRHPARAA